MINIPYISSHAYEEELEIDDIGSCNLIANNIIGEEYILVIDTNLGQTRIFEAGPIVPDLEILPKEVSYTFTQTPFNQQLLIKTITRFLNNYKRNIIQCREVSKEEALNECRDLVEYMKSDIY